MANQYTQKFVKKRFERLQKSAGKDFPAWSEVDGKQRANIGAWYLDNAPGYGGYEINEMVNQGGAVRQVTGYCNRMTGKELCQWMDGFEIGLNYRSDKK